MSPNADQNNPRFSITRRKLLLTAPVLVAAPLFNSPLARAVGRNAEVNVNDYYQGDWVAAFKQAFREGDVVVVPANVKCENVNARIFMPEGKTLKIAGAIKGNGRGRFILRDGCRIVGEGQGRMHNLCLDVRGSNCEIRSLDMSGKGPVTQIYIGGKHKQAPVIENLTIDRLHAHDANYGILRQGARNQLHGVRITNCLFQRLQGDAIEWNVAPHDSNIRISDHVIEDINCTNGKIHWGIGIGLAGKAYDNRYPEATSVKNFVVANIRGRNCRQLVHVECGKHFTIRNIKAENITPAFSRKAGLDNATVALYACDNFTIEHVDMINSAGMLIGYGTKRGKYVAIPQNFRIHDITMDNSRHDLPWKLRGLDISCGNPVSFVSLTNINLKHASLRVHNKPQHLFMRNISIVQPKKDGPALELNFDLRKDVRGHFMAKKDTLLSMTNIEAVNEDGQSSVDIDRIDHQKVNTDELNFVMPQAVKT
ncbi:colanic acid biosynthesis protein WcaM [Erwinia sp. CPCC 100877]|nr:colanic acid biosynthesis protein WcaM [Erwinia sp. CPCC 100877]